MSEAQEGLRREVVGTAQARLLILAVPFAPHQQPPLIASKIRPVLLNACDMFFGRRSAL